ncbi:MAG: rod shape-determining protein MreC [Bacteroidales bacterium]|nr:rod shape-determining protein MreC [Bacteroidales bacterium]MDP3002607.1 rod shape-determining protein MreC [Bacteroidales bacterium]
MKNLLNFLARYNNLIIFLILEGIAVYLLATGNNYHNTRVVNGIRGLINGIEEKINNTRTYLNLREINENLAAENVALRNSIGRLVKRENSLFFSVSDSIYRQQYLHTSAEVINNSINRQKNFFTINKGELHGIKVDMAVTSENSVAGVIIGCFANYSVAMSFLNLDFKLSARIKSNGYFGSLSWDGRDYSHAILSEIPQHVSVNMGDTIETTGYSAIFPEGVMVGTVSDFEKIGSDFYKITISLITDFKKLHFVDIIGNMKKTEQLELEKLFQ